MKNKTHRAWQQPMSTFQMMDEVCSGAKPKDCINLTGTTHMTPREKAIKLSEEYRRIEVEINLAGPDQRRAMCSRIAEIADEMRGLGYSLIELIRKRQIREGL